jgi:hypothetical protein
VVAEEHKVRKVEVPWPDFITQGVLLRRDVD